jgi:anti-sigma factor RsiW
MMTERDAEMLLPFYLNGTLSAEETDDVEQALTEHPELREELAFLRALREHMESQRDSTNSPGELGLRRLQQQLNSTEPKPVKQGWRMAAIAASFMLVLQTALTWQNDESVHFTPAGGGSEAGITGTLVSVTFVPSATEQQIRAVLLDSNSLIINGPSALGIYQLIVDDTDEQALARLEAQSIIESLQVQ